MEILQWLDLQSASAKNSDIADYLFLLYVVVSVLIGRSRFLLAFSLSVLLVECSLFDGLQGYQIYLTSFIAYSYIALQDIPKKTKLACVIMCVLDLILANDAYKYGIGGTHGASETFIYQSIEHLALYANLIIIFSLVSFGRIYDCICRMLDHAFSVKGDSYFMLIIWYTTYRTQSTNKPT